MNHEEVISLLSHSSCSFIHVLTVGDMFVFRKLFNLVSKCLRRHHRRPVVLHEAFRFCSFAARTIFVLFTFVFVLPELPVCSVREKLFTSRRRNRLFKRLSSFPMNKL